jgi:hypothetical protein
MYFTGMNGLDIIRQFLKQEGFETGTFSREDMHDYLIVHKGGYYAFTLDVRDTHVMLWKFWTAFRHGTARPERVFDLHHPSSLQDLTAYMDANKDTVKSQEVFA